VTFLEAIVLGLFQGIAEFLPISSSGHLVLLQKFFGIKEGNLFFVEMLHFGTLISIVIIYFKDIVKITVEFLRFLYELIKKRKFNLDNEYKVLAIMISKSSVAKPAFSSLCHT